MPSPIRDEQANAMGGCATCQGTATGNSTATTQPSPNSGNAANAARANAQSVLLVDPQKDTWIGISLVDASKRPMADEEYVVTPANGTAVRGKLDANGKARIEGIDPGSCIVEFPRLDKREFA